MTCRMNHEQLAELARPVPDSRVARNGSSDRHLLARAVHESKAASECLIRSSDQGSRMVDFDNDSSMGGQHHGRQPGRIDQFLLMHSARLDNWREITACAEAWQAGGIERAELDTAITAMEAVEGYYAYPGPTLFAALRERIAANDAASAARLARRFSNALLTRSYRAHPSEWDLHSERAADEVADVLPPGLEDGRPAGRIARSSSSRPSRPRAGRRAGRRDPPAPTSRGRLCLRTRLRRIFEDAFCAAAVNPALTSWWCRRAFLPVAL